MREDPQVGTLSADGHYYWDGSGWQPAPSARVEYVWNGTEWVVRDAGLTGAPHGVPAEHRHASSSSTSAAVLASVICGGAALILLVALGPLLLAAHLGPVLEAVALLPVLLIHVVYDSLAQRRLSLPHFGRLRVPRGGRRGRSAPPTPGGRPWPLTAAFYTGVVAVVPFVVATLGSGGLLLAAIAAIAMMAGARIAARGTRHGLLITLASDWISAMLIASLGLDGGLLGLLLFLAVYAPVYVVPGLAGYALGRWWRRRPVRAAA